MTTKGVWRQSLLSSLFLYIVNMATILNCTSTPELCAQAIIQFNATIAKYVETVATFNATIAKFEAVVSAGVEGRATFEYMRDVVELIFLFLVGVLIIFCMSIMLFHQFVIPRYKKTWDIATMQNMYVYVSNVVAGFVSLIGMVSVFNTLFFTQFYEERDKTTAMVIGCFSMVCPLMCAAELSFRPNMRPYLILHHMFCLFYMATMAFVARYMEDGYLTPFLRVCAVKTLQFNTEQCVFIGLIVRVYAKRATSEERRRKLYTWSQWLMLAGIVQTVIVKLGSTILVEVVLFRDGVLTDGFWDSHPATQAYALYLILEGVLLSPLQLFAGYVYWQIYQGTKKTYLRDKTDPHGTHQTKSGGGQLDGAHGVVDLHGVSSEVLSVSTARDVVSPDDVNAGQDVPMHHVMSESCFASEAQPALTRKLSIAAMLYSAQSPIRAARSSRHPRASPAPIVNGDATPEPIEHTESGNNAVEQTASSEPIS